ncbi:MAG: excinuclease ABC subunit UvrA [Planctomycetaceae bacterium]|nr:excinuclease ABC subunit UvrA [Planctomycetaceae bacterium]
MKIDSPQTSLSSSAGTISVRGAREHNLKNISLDIPAKRLVVITGLSGSGKSSLLYDTLFAAGRLRFLETVPNSSRRQVRLPQPPNVDQITGLPPVLTLAQHRGHQSVRATLLTLADLSRHLQLWFARMGTAHCPQCGQEVVRQTVEEIVERIMRLEDRRKVMILAPVVRGKTGAQKELLASLASRGFVRARIDGELVEFADANGLAPRQKHDVEVVIDRIIVKEGIEDRLTESVRLALREGNETCLISMQTDDGWEDRLYSSRYACVDCDLAFAPLESRSFSPFSPYGACAECDGKGVVGEENEICPECRGTCLNAFSRNVRYQDMTFPECLSGSVDDALIFWQSVSPLADETDPVRTEIFQRLQPQIVQRLQVLKEVGLGYLTLDRRAVTLSGGEYQRARLSAVLAGGLTHVAYLLDEPTSGLHAADAARLLKSLQRLRDRGNSVIVVEHDPLLIAGADHLIELGPGAGRAGGEIIAQGTPDELRQLAETPTSRLLSGDSYAQSSLERPVDQTLRLTGVRCHNLSGIDVEIPLGAFVALSGVSGSGKSTLVHDVCQPTRRKILNRDDQPCVRCETIEGADAIHALRVVDQSPLGQNGRSNPATATGIWNEVRRIFSGTKEAKLRGFNASRFSFQSSAGRCGRCKGRGELRYRQAMLPDVKTVCPSCRGRRFNEQTLSILYKGRNVADVLEMSLLEAAAFFVSFPVVAERLQVLCEMGLGYLQLGQPAPTLSGGEAQRIKLATELGKLKSGPTLFLLDEPTSGLHADDVKRLIGLFQRLVEEGHTVLVIEHELQMLAAADWLIDLGPGAGVHGGEIVAVGSPQQLAENSKSLTGRALRNLMSSDDNA